MSDGLRRTRVISQAGKEEQGAVPIREDVHEGLDEALNESFPASDPITLTPFGPVQLNG
jgi:hypothetical protein